MPQLTTSWLVLATPMYRAAVVMVGAAGQRTLAGDGPSPRARCDPQRTRPAGAVRPPRGRPQRFEAARPSASKSRCSPLVWFKNPSHDWRVLSAGRGQHCAARAQQPSGPAFRAVPERPASGGAEGKPGAISGPDLATAVIDEIETHAASASPSPTDPTVVRVLLEEGAVGLAPDCSGHSAGRSIRFRARLDCETPEGQPPQISTTRSAGRATASSSVTAGLRCSGQNEERFSPQGCTPTASSS